MIVETDFPDHWKTQLLIQLTADPAAPVMMIRLWAHCQTRKAWRFSDLSDAALAAICRWKHEPAKLRAFLIESGFITEDADEQGSYLVVHDFEVINATLVRNWSNGVRHAAKSSALKTQAEPNGKPDETQRGSDRLDRVDRRDGLDRGDRESPPTPASGAPGRGSDRRSSKRPAKPLPSITPDKQPDALRGRMLALNAIFRRPPTDAWNAAEQLALESSGLLAMAELDFIDACEAVRAYYHASIPREIQKQFWKRTTLDKLLENWGGELDKSRLWARERADGISKV